MSSEAKRAALAQIERAVFRTIVGADWREMFRRPVHNSVTEQIRAAEKSFGKGEQSTQPARPEKSRPHDYPEKTKEEADHKGKRYPE